MSSMAFSRRLVGPGLGCSFWSSGCSCSSVIGVESLKMRRSSLASPAPNCPPSPVRNLTPCNASCQNFGPGFWVSVKHGDAGSDRRQNRVRDFVDLRVGHLVEHGQAQRNLAQLLADGQVALLAAEVLEAFLQVQRN